MGNSAAGSGGADFMKDSELSSAVKFKGGDPTNKEKIEAFFEINTFQSIKQAYNKSESLQSAFEDVGVRFPKDETEVSGFLFDLQDEQADQLVTTLIPSK